MAGFYACLKNQDDPTMAESLSEVSGSLEVLEANDEVKKKSKFKAFKNFFGKRKKKEPEGARGGRRLKASLSSGSINISSLKPVREGQRNEARAKSSMGSKALSHDSIFMLDPEPEISVHRICPSPERQRGRPRQRSQASRTLPRSGTSDVHGGVSGLVFGAVPKYVPRSGIWIGGSKVAEFPSLRRRHSSSSPPLIRSHTTSADFEETSVDEESPKIPQRKDLPIKIMSVRKSSFEPSPGPTRSQCMSTYALIASPSRTHLPMSLNSPASTCLDSSPARHKMALNSRKQKKRKNPQATGKAKQEEPILLVASGEEKSTTKTREADKWKPRRDGAGVSSLKHSKRTEMQDKKPVDKAAWASGAWGESRESAAQGKLRSKQGSSASGSTECAPRGRRFKPSSRGPVPSERAGSPSANKNARDCRLRNLSLERQVMEQPATRQAQRTPPQEPLPDGDGKRKRKAGIDLNTRKAPVSQSLPEARAESVVWGPSPGREDRASGAEQPEARAPLSSGTESLSTASEDVIFSVAMEAQVFMDSSHLQSEGEEAFSFDLQTIKLKMESVQDIPAVCRERSPANILRAFTASISGPASARAERGISAERLTPRSLSWVLRKPRAGDGSSDPESPSEEDSGSKQQLLPRGSLQSSGKPHDDQDVFTGSESSARELSSPERQLAARYSAGAFGSTEAEEASSDPESALVEEESGSEPQRAPSHPFQPLEEPDDDQEASDSESSSNSSGSDELLTPTSAAQALGEPEDQMSTESDGYVEKYDSAEEWSSADELGPPGPPSQASAKPADQQQVASVSQILSAEWGVSVERLALSFSKPILPQQMSKGSARPPAPSSSPVEPTPTRQPVQPRPSPQAEPQTSAGPDSTAAQWDIPPEPLPARISSKHLGRPWVEQAVSKSPEISTAVGLFSAELLPPLPPRPHSHPLLEPITEQAFQEPVWVPAVEGSICVELPPPRHPSQTVLRPVVEQQVCLGAESAGVDQNALVQPPQLPRLDSQSPTRPLVPQQAPDGPEMPATPAEPWSPQGLAQASVNPIAEPSVFSGLEATAAAAEKVISMEPLLPTYSAQALTNARGVQASEADGTCTEGASAELPPRDPSQPAVWPKVPPQPAPPEPVGASTPGAALVPGPASPRTVYRSWLSSSFEQQDSEREESAALEWGISLEPRAPLPPLPPRKTSQNPRRRAVKRANSRRSASAPPEQSSPPEQRSMPPEQRSPPEKRSTPPEQRSPPEQQSMPPEQCSPPEQRSTPPEQCSPPEQQSVPPEQRSPPPQQQSAPPEQCSPPPEQQSVPPEQQSTPPEQQSAPPEQHSPPPEQQSVPPEQCSPPPEQQSVPPEQQSTPPEQQSTPPEQPSPPPEQRSPPPEQQSAPPEQRSPPPEQQNAAPEQHSLPPEQQSVLPEQQGGPPGQWNPPPELSSAPTEQQSAPLEQHSAPPEQRSAPPERRSAPAEPKLPRCSVRSRGSTKVKQPVSEALEGAEALRRIAMEQHSLRRSSKTKAVVKQAAFLAPDGSMAQKSISTEQPPPRMASQAPTKAVVKQPAFLVPDGSLTQRSVSSDQLSSRMASQALTKAMVKQAAFLAPDGSMAQKSVSTEQPPPRMASQALTKTVVKQQAFLVPDGSLTQRSVSIDQLSSRMASQALTKAVAKQPAFLAPEGSMAQRSISSDQLSPRMHSQALTKTVVKQPAFLVPDGSLTQRSVSTDQLSSRMASQALTKAVVRQQVSAAPEKFATKRVASTEPWPSKKPSQSPGRYRVQQISYNFESVAAQTAMYAKPVASKYPTQFSSRSKVQEMSSRIENTVAERSAKKPPVSRHPSQSFVKFMAEKVFTESAANSLSTNQLSKSFLRSKVQYPVFLGPENASTEGAVSSKLLPLAHPLQPLGRPEGPREVLPRSESVPTKPKQSSSKEQGPPRHLFMAPAKLEYQQVSSASQSSPEIWKSSEEPLPSRGPHQAKEGAELQPRLFLAGPVSVPGDWNMSEEHQPRHRRYPCQVLTEPEYLPQVRPGSVSAAAVGATSESHPGSWSLSRGPASPNKTRKFRQVSEDLHKNTLLRDPKPMKFTTASTRQTSTVGGTYSKGEGLKSSDRNNSHPYESTRETGVETIFGVRLRKVPSLKKYKSEKQDDILKFSSLSLGPISSSTEQQIKSFSQGLQGTAENPSTASDLAEKQQTRPQSESMAKKQPIYKVPGKALGQHSDCTASEPAWITMVKQKQRSSQVQIPKKETKTKNKAGAKPEAKEPRHGGELAATHRTLQKGGGLATENQSRKTSASDVNKLEKTAEKKLPKFTKAGFKDQKIAQMPAMAKDTRRSSTLPAVVQAPAEPEEPVWFSLAKEKAKAWTHISEILQ
ncbi:acrosomal protein KIAA1210 homolog isoform X2 [Mustela erminea]|uniref:acrosomal protein KIAA1210 homolog isoform X2 n=1 Tax=Mustela erminea TaxID=36723 RepID=UPI001386D608|nr:acrosomal protein KIAA1210 homolog isoform X2 [Mustela erminea]